jgi:hypothetical protein
MTLDWIPAPVLHSIVPLSDSIIDGSRTHKSYIRTRWHCARTINKVCLVRLRDTEDAQVSHRRCKGCIPLAFLKMSVVYGTCGLSQSRLTLTVDKTLEDLSYGCVGIRKIDVRLEAVDTSRMGVCL